MNDSPVYECQKSKLCADEWVVEAIDYASEGMIYAATFSGPGAEQRAEEYAAWKNGSRNGASMTINGNINFTISSNQAPGAVAREVEKAILGQRRFRVTSPNVPGRVDFVSEPIEKFAPATTAFAEAAKPAA